MRDRSPTPKKYKKIVALDSCNVYILPTVANSSLRPIFFVCILGTHAVGALASGTRIRAAFDKPLFFYRQGECEARQILLHMLLTGSAC